jgi:O-antigen/teichoic acid export membrane protein
MNNSGPEIVSKSSPQKGFVVKSGIALSGRIFGRGIGYLSQILFARILAPEGYGLFAIGWTLLRLFSIAGHLGLDYGVVRFGSQYWQKNNIKLRSVAFIAVICAFVSGLIFGVLLYGAAPWLASEFFKKPDLVLIFQGFAIAFPFATTLRVAAATSSISGNMLPGAVAEDIAQPVLQILLFMILLSLGMEMRAAVLSVGISYGIAVVLALFMVTKTIPQILSGARILTDDLVPMFRFSLPAIVGVTLGAFNLWGDRLLVGYFSTEVNTGIYQSISILTMFTTTILSGFKIAISPPISSLHHNNDLVGLKLLARSTVRWMFYISMPVLIFVIVDAKQLITALFGTAYQSGTVPLIILTIGQIFYVSFGITDQVFVMTGNQKEWVKISAFIFMLTILLDALMIPKYQLIGASVVSTSMMLLLGVIAVTRLKHRMSFWLFDIHHVKILGISFGIILITFPIAAILPFGFLVNAILILCLITVLFTSLLLITGLEESDKLMLKQVIKRLQGMFLP